jgi:predicted N-acyltransferase
MSRTASNCSRACRVIWKSKNFPAHINFTDPFTDAAMAEQPGWLQRIGCQYHWQNRGYRDFQDFLDVLSSRKRKQMRKEREQVAGQGFEFEWLQGTNWTRRNGILSTPATPTPMRCADRRRT